LVEECALLHGCSTGNTKITRGHKLPAKFILHTVGPRCYNTITKLPVEKLQRCYTSCLSHVPKHKLKSVAFCCISTGIFSYPNEAAAFTALLTIRDWLTKSDNYKRIDRVILCVFEEKDLKIYEQMMQVFFPPVSTRRTSNCPVILLTSGARSRSLSKRTQSITLMNYVNLSESLVPNSPSTFPISNYFSTSSVMQRPLNSSQKLFQPYFVSQCVLKEYVKRSSDNTIC
jgi:O-acetyl-ADP-ribose deacetylase (regulator of RNase III)